MYHLFLILSFLVIGLSVIPMIAANAQQESGLVAHWTCDEGSGETLKDISGNGNHGSIHGARWVKQGKGYALRFDGVDDYVDCGNSASLDLTRAVTLEAWVKPELLPAAEPMIFGKYYDSYALTHYRDGNTWFYISGGGNNLNGHLEVGKWTHVAATFDGTTMTLFINRQKVASKKSKSSVINHGKNFFMGVLFADPNASDPGYSGTTYWQGVLDEVRVYDHALGAEEILRRYKQTAAEHDVDTTWFDKIRVATFAFRTEKRLLALLDFSNIFSRQADAILDVSITKHDNSQSLQKQDFRNLPSAGMLCAAFPVSDLPPGRYGIKARLADASGLNITTLQPFRLPLPDLEVPSPAKKHVGNLPDPIRPPRFACMTHPGGGFTITIKGHSFPLESSFSYPQGGNNRLVAGTRDAQGEPEWSVTTRLITNGCYEVNAKGKFYSIHRRLRVYPDRVSIQDVIRNETTEDVGIILDNYLDAKAVPFSHRTVAGYPGAIERKESQSPSTFVAWKDFGIGLVPLDDVYIIHSTVYAKDNRAGIVDDKLGIAPGDACTLEWAVYPTASSDYYDFINAVRRNEKRNGVTVEGGFAFVPREPFSKEYAEIRNLLYASFGCLAKVADDPEIEIEGIEFLTLPKERARIKAEFEAIRKVNPHLKMMFHVAHSLWSTNKPSETFPDSRVLDAKGNHVIYPYDYDACVYFSPQRHKEGWRWYIYYPTPGNSFHDALMKSVDVMVDEIGCGGVFMDGFFYGYGSPYTYDRWDGRTVEIDPETKTIKRKVGSVLLLSQPSMAEFTKRMVAKGAVVIANNVVQSRTISSLPIIVDQECRTGPDVHLAQTPCALGNPSVIKNEVDVYRDVIDKLKFANLYFYYGEGTLTHPSLPQQMYPITIEEIHAGTIKGRERIVTMNSGIYGWRGSRDLHFCYRYNEVGVPIPAEFITTVDASGARTHVTLEPKESAVVKRIPVRMRSHNAVNLVCERYDAGGIVLALNGEGKVGITIANGEFAVRPDTRYRLSDGKTTRTLSVRNGVLFTPLILRGQTRLRLEAE